ncbi:MAG TPA: hypothetical protein VMW58_07920 [Anaerolineae bacterium]|nr:hypothetical protein [Anaerolineae bacterium]
MAIDTAWGAGPKSAQTNPRTGMPTGAQIADPIRDRAKQSFVDLSADSEQGQLTLEKMRMENEMLKAQLQQLKLQLEQMRKQMGGA